MSCYVNNNFSKYMDKTKFKESQIKSLYNHFRKYSRLEDKMEYDAFKNSLGIIGYKDNFVSERLFKLICKGKGNFVFIIK